MKFEGCVITAGFKRAPALERGRHPRCELRIGRVQRHPVIELAVVAAVAEDTHPGGQLGRPGELVADQHEAGDVPAGQQHQARDDQSQRRPRRPQHDVDVKRDGLSYEEAARKTRLNVSTVTNYVFEARAKVKMMLRDREE